MGLKEDVIALADELEEFEDGDCEECSLYGQPECKGHLSCMEIMARYAARKMREAVERRRRRDHGERLRPAVRGRPQGNRMGSRARRA